MARADLLVSLVQSGMRGDKTKLRKVAEALIAEERSKQHKILADRLESVLNNSQEFLSPPPAGGSMPQSRQADFFSERTPQRRLEDLILPNEISDICRSFIQEHHRVDLLRSYNLEPRNRILLIGPPGNGKTSLAEALAEALMVPLLVVRYENIIGTYLGETAVRLKNLFDYASSRKCVLFFDEFETLGKERGDTHETGEIKRVVSSLLLQIDNLPSHVVVIGATNHAELLDRAVWRRFQIRMSIPGPTRARLTEWFERYQKKAKISFGYSSSALAKRLYGSNFSEAEEFCKNIIRQYVLEQPGAEIRQIVTTELKLLAAQTAKTEQLDDME
ncbi:AAA family ATPase [Vreelandella zhanjiangensis]|uniref:AAA family ATPase n=1 Tax=Vreelandella zhanjiangensis TaxID=1121960 RepID=UPI00402AE870